MDEDLNNLIKINVKKKDHLGQSQRIMKTKNQVRKKARKKMFHITGSQHLPIEKIFYLNSQKM